MYYISCMVFCRYDSMIFPILKYCSPVLGSAANCHLLLWASGACGCQALSSPEVNACGSSLLCYEAVYVVQRSVHTKVLRHGLSWMTDVNGRDLVTGQDFFFCVRGTFHVHSPILTLFLCFIVSFQSCCSHARVFGKTLMHEFPIFSSHTEWNLLSSGTNTLLWWRACYKITKLQTTKLHTKSPVVCELHPAYRRVSAVCMWAAPGLSKSERSLYVSCTRLIEEWAQYVCELHVAYRRVRSLDVSCTRLI